MNGQGNFVILGMERIGKNLSQVRGHGEDARTLQLNSTTSGMTGQTGKTIPEPPGEGDTTTEMSRRTTLPSIGPASMITETSEMTGPEWQLKGDSMAEERMRKLVMEAQSRSEDIPDIGRTETGLQMHTRAGSDTMAKDKPPDNPMVSDGDVLLI